eukprot:TRINITY_DN20211_c0_g1_i2.p4 TRINITY_DN20211_c0_g1~~TRINITY_DN20211_c0_g1_i2.p4  ORF type:complete len:161 (-),score=9.95 TRINITY_DN20211_c0_g1_i2:489-971(-)
MMYYGDINNIPSGWQLCDGSNLNGVTIPDLRGRFPLGETQNDSQDGPNRVPYATPIGKLGGSFQKVLTESELPKHAHTMQSNGEHVHSFDDYYYAESDCSIGSNVYGSGATNDWNNKYCSVTHDTYSAGNHTHTIGSIGQSQPFDIVPPFAVVYFICKIN